MNRPKQKKDNTNWKWIVLFAGLLWMFTFSNRMALSPLMGFLRNEWNLTAYEIGVLGSVIYFPYLIFQLPSGIVADKWNRKSLLVWGGILQGLAMIGCSISNNIIVFGFFRALTGLFSASIFSSLFGYISNVTPPKKKAAGIAAINFFMPLGVILGTVITSEIVFRYQKNWQSTFLIFGLGIIIFSIILGLYTKGQDKGEIIAEQKKDQKNRNIKNSLLSYLLYIRKFMKNSNLLYLSLISFIQAYTLFNIFTWLPYLLGTKGFNALDAGNFSSFAYLLALPTIIYITLRVGKNQNIKKYLLLFMLINLISNLFIVSSINRNILIFALIVYGLTARISTTPLHIHLVTESSDSKNYSKDLAIFNTFSCLSMLIAPIITGYLYDLTNSIKTGFYLAIFLETFALIIMYFGVTVSNKSIDKKNASLALKNKLKEA